MKKDIDTLKDPINILEDDKLFDVSMYWISYILPKCNQNPTHANLNIEEELGGEE